MKQGRNSSGDGTAKVSPMMNRTLRVMESVSRVSLSDLGSTANTRSSRKPNTKNIKVTPVGGIREQDSEGSDDGPKPEDVVADVGNVVIGLDSGTNETKILKFERVDGDGVKVTLLATLPSFKGLFVYWTANTPEIETLKKSILDIVVEVNPYRCFAGVTSWYRTAQEAERMGIKNFFKSELPRFDFLVLTGEDEAYKESIAVGYAAERSRIGRPDFQIAAGGGSMNLVQRKSVFCIELGFRQGQYDLMEAVNTDGNQASTAAGHKNKQKLTSMAAVVDKLKRRAEKIFKSFLSNRPDFIVSPNMKVVGISAAYYAARGAEIDCTKPVSATDALRSFEARRDLLIEGLTAASSGDVDVDTCGIDGSNVNKEFVGGQYMPEKKTMQEISNLINFCEMFKVMLGRDAEVYFRREWLLDGVPFLTTWTAGHFLDLENAEDLRAPSSSASRSSEKQKSNVFGIRNLSARWRGDDAEYEKRQRDAWTAVMSPLSSELHRREQSLSLGMHRANALIITAIIAYTDFDDPIFVVIFVLGMYSVVAIDLYLKFGLEWCIAAQVLFIVLAVHVSYTAVLVNRTEKYASHFRGQELALKSLIELGPNSTSVDAQPLQMQVNTSPTDPGQLHSRKTLSNLHKLNVDVVSGKRFMSKVRMGSVTVATNRDLLFLMSEASLLLDEFTVDVLEPLLQAASAQGRTGEMKCGLKRAKRAMEKTKTDYDGNCFRLLDLLRGCIICNTFEDVLACFHTMDELEKNGTFRIIRIKNRFRDGSVDGSGYCDANYNIEFKPSYCRTAQTVRGHICEVQIHLRDFYDVHTGSHNIYKIVRALHIEGKLRAVSDATKIPFTTRAATIFLQTSAAAIGLMETVLYRYYAWAGFASWSAKEGGHGASLTTAVYILIHLMVFYVALARIIRTVRSKSKPASLCLQLVACVGIILFGFYQDFVLEFMTPKPDPNAWQLTSGSDTIWVRAGSLSNAASSFNDENRAYLKPVAKVEVLWIVLLPYVLVGLLFVRDFVRSYRMVGQRSRMRTRVGIWYDRYLGINGRYFEYRVLLQQYCTVLLQAYSKLPTLGAAVWASKFTRSAAIQTDNVEFLTKLVYWAVLATLVLNSLYPAILLRSTNYRIKRDLSTTLDAIFDMVYVLTSVLCLHFTVGPAAASGSTFQFGSNFVPAFHMFTVACGLEFAAMQRTIAKSSMKGRNTLVKRLKDDTQKAKIQLKHSVAFSFCALMTIVVIVLIYSDRYPLATDEACRPCTCFPKDGLVLESCDVAATLLPQEFFLSGLGLTGVGPDVFAQGFETLSHLDLSFNELAHVQSLPPTVEHLELGNNDSWEETPLENDFDLALALKPLTKLEHLSMFSNLLGNKAVEVGEALSSMLNLKEVIFRGNRIDDEGLEKLLNFNPEKLLKLHLESNIITDIGMTHIQEFLKKAPNIQFLSLGQNRFSAKASPIVAGSLHDKKDLVVFGFVASDVDPAGGKLIAEALRDKASLRLLYMGNNRLGNDGANAFVEVVAGKPIQVFYMGSNQITDASAIRLALELEQSELLESVSLSSNPISSTGIAEIENILSRLGDDLLVSQPDRDCSSICPSGVLSDPEAPASPSSMTCQEKENEIFSNPLNLEIQCFSLFFDAVLKTDCCGPRKIGCPLDCPDGAVFNHDGTMDTPGFGNMRCSTLKEMGGAHAEFNCEEAALMMNLTDCCYH